MVALHLFAVLALVAVNAFFAAAEFSLVAVRLSRVRQLVEKGDARAKIVESLLGDLSRVVSGVQVGITLASLSPTKLQALEPYITARSQVYRVQVVGTFDSGGPTARVEAVIDTNNGRPRIVSYRNLTELGKGFDSSLLMP